jgi:DNA repair ATPase RecN
MALFKLNVNLSKKGLASNMFSTVLNTFIGELKNKNISVTLNTVKVDPNRSRSVRLSEAQSLIDEARSIVEELQDEMQNWYDGMPENLQGSDKGSQVEECADALRNLCDEIEGLDFDIEFPGMY